MKNRNALKFNEIHVLWSDYLHDEVRGDSRIILTLKSDASNMYTTASCSSMARNFILLAPRLRSAAEPVDFIGHNKSEKQLVQTFHRKTDSLAVGIYFQHFHFDVLLKFYNCGRV